jgi:hypothetical protein
MSINKIKTIALDDDAVTSSKIGDNQVGLSELNVTDGTTGQALITDGSGALSFSTVSTDLSNYYTKTQTDSAISGVIDSAPGALDTLNELAASLADDADFAGTMTTALSGKAATGHTHTVAGITDLTSTAAELNYTTDVTSLIQAQLDLKSGTSHAHTGTYLPLTGGALSGGITVTGTVGATALTGDGSGLTGVGVAGIVSSADATAITIDANEDVGIGGSPLSRLTIEKSTAPEVLIRRVDTSTGFNTNEIGRISFGGKEDNNTDRNTAQIRSYADGAWTGSQATGNLKFYTTSSTDSLTPQERLHITSDGRGLSQFTAKSWVNFSGENVLTVRDSHNVSSVTDRGVGEYTMNFSNNMANDDYAAAGLPRYDFVGGVCYFETLSVSNITLVNINNLDALADSSTSTVIIFGD